VWFCTAQIYRHIFITPKNVCITIFLDLFWLYLNWPRFIWTVFAAIGRSHGRLGRRSSLQSAQSSLAWLRPHHTPDEMRTVEMRWEIGTLLQCHIDTNHRGDAGAEWSTSTVGANDARDVWNCRRSAVTEGSLRLITLLRNNMCIVFVVPRRAVLKQHCCKRRSRYT